MIDRRDEQMAARAELASMRVGMSEDARSGEAPEGRRREAQASLAGTVESQTDVASISAAAPFGSRRHVLLSLDGR